MKSCRKSRTNLGSNPGLISGNLGASPRSPRLNLGHFPRLARDLAEISSCNSFRFRDHEFFNIFFWEWFLLSQKPGALLRQRVTDHDSMSVDGSQRELAHLPRFV